VNASKLLHSDVVRDDGESSSSLSEDGDITSSSSRDAVNGISIELVRRMAAASSYAVCVSESACSSFVDKGAVAEDDDMSFSDVDSMDGGCTVDDDDIDAVGSRRAFFAACERVACAVNASKSSL